MNIFEQKINYILSFIGAFFSAIFGHFWFLFVFLIILNILDYITGTLKARYLKIESSSEGLNGTTRTLYTWIIIALGFGVSFIFVEVGQYFGKNISFMMFIGWFILINCIINEIRSILENITQMDKGECVPNWLTRGLKVTQELIDKKANKFVDKIQKEVNKEENYEDSKNDITQ